MENSLLAMDTFGKIFMELCLDCDIMDVWAE